MEAEFNWNALLDIFINLPFKKLYEQMTIFSIYIFICTIHVCALWYMYNETPMVRGLAADNNNKLYTETMIFLWNNHYNLNFIM